MIEVFVLLEEAMSLKQIETSTMETSRNEPGNGTTLSREIFDTIFLLLSINPKIILGTHTVNIV